MKKILLLIAFCFFAFISAQEKKKDSVTFDKQMFEYKPRIFYPYDCSCPGEVIYKELKKGDKEFNPYQYEYQNPIRLDSLPKAKSRDKSLPFIRKA